MFLLFRCVFMIEPWCGDGVKCVRNRSGFGVSIRIQRGLHVTSRPDSARSARRVLAERFAAGELLVTDFEERRRVLG